MARPLSKKTIAILGALWWLPWVSASELAAILSRELRLETAAVNNVLKRAEKRGWLTSATLGRERDAQLRWVYTNAGVEWGEKQGWERQWWHRAAGVRALARRIQILEAVYEMLANLPSSNLLANGRIHVFRSRVEVNERTGEPMRRWRLDEAQWRDAVLVKFMWVEKKRFDAVLGFAFGGGEAADGTELPWDIVYIPVLWCGRFDQFKKSPGFGESWKRWWWNGRSGRCFR